MSAAIVPLALLLTSAAALPQTTSDNEIYVTVNGRPIMRATLASVAESLERRGTTATEAELLDELVNLELLAQAAEADRLERDPEVAAALQLQYTQTMANAWLAKTEAALRPTPEAVEAAYADYVDAFDAEEYRLAHVLVPAEAIAREAIAALDAGQSFENVAERFSTDPTPEGELGWLTDETMLPGFRSAVEGLGLEQYTPVPVQTGFGWHVIRLLDVRPAAAPPLGSVRPELRARLVQTQLLERLAALRADADIEYTAAAQTIVGE